MESRSPRPGERQRWATAEIQSVHSIASRVDLTRQLPQKANVCRPRCASEAFHRSFLIVQSNARRCSLCRSRHGAPMRGAARHVGRPSFGGRRGALPAERRFPRTGASRTDKLPSLASRPNIGVGRPSAGGRRCARVSRAAGKRGSILRHDAWVRCILSPAQAVSWRAAALAEQSAEYGLPNPAIKRTRTGRLRRPTRAAYGER